MSFLNQYLSHLSRACHALLASEQLLNEAASLIARTEKPVFGIGVGKSSYIARKFAASLQSLSKPAHFLHPGEALHGDCGVIPTGAICLVISKSGNSSEINDLLPILLRRGVQIVAITNGTLSPLARAATLVLPLGVSAEGDVHNLLPLVSCEVSLVICDYLVARVAERTGFNPKQFAENHPAGQIGLNLNRSLNDLREWRQRRPFVRIDASMIDALVCMSETKAGMCCVVDESRRLLGIITDGDVRRALTGGDSIQQMRVREIMNRSPRSALQDTSLQELLTLMEGGTRAITALPLIDKERRCEGVLLIHDLLGTVET